MRVVVPIEMADTNGGMLASVELLLRFLPRNLEKIVFLPAGSGNAERMKAAGAQIVYSSRSVWSVDRTAPVRTFQSFVSFRRELRPLLTSGTVLLTNNIAAELLCGLGGARSGPLRIFVNRGDEYSGVSARALRSSLRSCERCVATTTYQKRILIETLGVNPGRVHLIPNGVDVAELSGALDDSKPDWHESGKLHVATIGFPSSRKNQELLIRSIALLKPDYPELRGVIIGSPGCDSDRRYLESLRQMVSTLALDREIAFVPFTKNRKTLFSGVDILASTAVREGFGRTIIEAMAAGRPVVALRAGGPETIIQNGVTGLLVSQNSPDAFAHALRELVRNDGLRSRIVEKARTECLSRYNAAAVAAQYFSLFEECLNVS